MRSSSTASPRTCARTSCWPAQLGIQGVPFFVLDRRYGVSGAQPPEVLAQAPSNGRGARRLVSAREDRLSSLAAALAIASPPPPTPPAGSRSRRPAGPTSTRSARAHRGRCAARRLEEGRRRLPHARSRPTARSAPTSPIQSGLGEHQRPGARRRARRPAGVLGRDPHDRLHRDQPGPQHGVLAPTAAPRGRCSPARSSRSARRPTRATRARRRCPNGTTLQAWFGHARDVGARGARPGDAELQLPGAPAATATTRGSPPRERRGDAGLVLERRGAAGRPRAGRQRGRLARRARR